MSMFNTLGVFSDKRWRSYSFFLLFQALYSLHPWFLWWLPMRVAVIVFFLIHSFFLLSSNFWNVKDSKRIGAAVLLIVLLQYQAIGSSLPYHIQKFLEAVALLPLILLKSHYQVDLLNKFQKVMVVILAVSLFFWAGHLLGLDLPSREITFGTVERGGVDQAQYVFSNHYLYLVNQRWLYNLSTVPPQFRFSSVFLEPGYISIIAVFFLFINKFDFRNKMNIVYIIAVVASVSLAGFLMAVLAYLANSLKNSKYGLVSIVLLMLFLWAGSNYFQTYNNGRNFINEGIIQRLEIDQTTGNIAGYNRTSETFDSKFDRFLYSGDVFFGIRRDGMEREFGDAANVGYKVYIMTYGLIGLILFLIYLFNISRFSKNYQSYILMLLYIVMFVRGHHTMWSYAFMLVYICGVIDSRLQDVKVFDRRQIISKTIQNK